MEYQHTPSGENYAMYAAGGVFYAAPGHTAFPVRLAVELCRRCLAIRAAQGATGPAVVYDPCCGGAYHLATMAFFNWEQIAAIYASDLDEDALGIAARNLSLLTAEGMARRMTEIADLHAQFGKPSHAAALEHARVLRQRLTALSVSHPLPTRLFRADATDSLAVAAGLGDAKMDIVFADVPYGRWANWHGDTVALAQRGNPVRQMLGALLPQLAEGAVIVVAAAKQDKLIIPDFDRLAKLNAGKRQIVILRPH